MEIGALYNFILLIVLCGMILGVGIIVLDKFSTSAGISATASTAVNNTRTSLTPIASTWMPLIVTVAVLSIVLTLVIRSFGQQGR